MDSIDKQELPNIDHINLEHTKYLGWIQSFSKKVVTVFSILYVVIIIVMITMLGYEIKVGYTEGLSTMITEINETFRVVIGGYLIKAAVENGFKITGTYLTNINRIKLNSVTSHLSNHDNSLSDNIEEDGCDTDDEAVG